MRRRWWVAAVAVLLFIAGLALSSTASPPAPGALTGSVVDAAGTPIAGASVSDGRLTAVTNATGGFELAAGDGWVTVRADGWLPRTRAARVGEPVMIRLAKDEPRTVSFAFGGDVMFGRRYYDPEEDGRGGGLLSAKSGVAEHAALLEGVAPAFADADLAVVNLESPLAPDPAFDPTAQRPASFHPTKEFAFASAPAAAGALAATGIDVVGLANNHLYDRLEDGVTTTRTALEEAGFAAGEGYFGAGRSVADAWRPAVSEVRGQRVAFLGCTTITGEEHEIGYVATAAQGGAASCDAPRLRREVTAARRAADVVVVMLHGGYEYGRDPSARIRTLSDAAVAAGATMVVNHHPHVVGGLRFAEGRLTAWTLGNLLFDQTVWPTFDSYVLRAAVHHGAVVSAWIEPLRLQGFKPTAVTGTDADWVARGALARSDGPWAVDDGSLWLDAAGDAETRTATVTGSGLHRLVDGCSPDAGRELLWTGHFEDHDLNAAAGVPLWNVSDDNPDRRVEQAAGYGDGRGVRLRRSGGSRDPILLAPLHRVLVEPGTDLTVLVRHRRVSGRGDVALQLGWYNDTRGPSQARTVVALEPGGDWDTVRLDVRVPANAVAVHPFFRVSRPGPSLNVVDVDDFRLIAWDEPGCDWVRGSTEIVQRNLPPSPEASPAVTLSVAGRRVPTPDALPPGPGARGD